MIANRDALATLRKRFESNLTTVALGRHTQWLREAESTNSVARIWADQGAVHGSLVFADHQTGGRGRHDRTWITSPGLNLTVSLALRPDFPASRYGLITLAASLAVNATIQHLCAAVNTKIKWPNDLLVNNRKCCGMLLESVIAGDTRESYVILGIGLNVNEVEFPESIQQVATSLKLATGQQYEREFVLVELLNRLEEQLRVLDTEPERIVSAYQSCMAGLGNPLLVNDVHSGESFEGILMGVDSTGALLLKMNTQVQAFHAGEIKLL